MASNKLTIKLTDEQQSQIKDAIGKNINELNIDLGAIGNLSEKDLDNVSAGFIWGQHEGPASE